MARSKYIDCKADHAARPFFIQSKVYWYRVSSKYNNMLYTFKYFNILLKITVTKLIIATIHVDLIVIIPPINHLIFLVKCFTITHFCKKDYIWNIVL
jgi:hypothetical protein